MITFWRKVDFTGFCWLWTAYTTPKGYGQFRLGSAKVYAHRLSYETLVGPIPEGLQIDHLCRVRACVNPDHLEPVTSKINSLRSPLTLQSMQSARTHCPQGHPYSGANLYIHPDGSRRCRECKRARARAERLCHA